MSFAAELDVAGRTVVVVGGAAGALGTISRLVELGADVTVVSPDVATSIRDLAERGLLAWLSRPAEPADFHTAALVVAATGSADSDAEVRAAAARGNAVAATVRTAPETVDRAGRGRVVLVGGGPGDPGQLTVAGLEAIRSADVIVSDRLAPLAALRHARAQAEIVDVG
ncbi:MAG TPA: NAD(P)-dependent oxidoreductase, partial [Propionibacteriaceae bacterium]|nr:NAD(P)-dependent oxidoreductase [Propionibacteriaceae bacterium]